MSSDYDDPREGNFEEEREPNDARIIARAKERIKTPAVLLLVVGIIGAVLALLNIPSLFTLDQQFAQVEDQWDKDPNLQPQQKQDMKKMLGDVKGPIKMFLPISIAFGVLTGGLTVLGAVKIMNLKSRGLGVLASVVSMLPIVSGCCCLGLPAGIWVMIVLGKPEVKAGFEAVARAARSEY